MTYLIVMGSLSVVLCGVVAVFLARVVPSDLRKIQAERQSEAGAQDADEASIWSEDDSESIWSDDGDGSIWSDDCRHDDVLEDWSGALEDDSLGLTPPGATVIDQEGVCQTCGARVVRHGRPGEWNEWMPLDPEDERTPPGDAEP